jgi:hypothetical protein
MYIYIYTHTQQESRATLIQSVYRGHLHRAIIKCPFSGAGLVLSPGVGGAPPKVTYVVVGGAAHNKVFEGDEILQIDGLRCPEVWLCMKYMRVHIPLSPYLSLWDRTNRTC